MATTVENGHALAVDKAIGNGKVRHGVAITAAAPPPAEGWRFARCSKEQGAIAATGDTLSIRAVRFKIMASVEERGPRPVLPLAHGDPSAFPAFRTAAEAEDAVAAALHTGEFNCYPAGVGLPAARRYGSLSRLVFVSVTISASFCLFFFPKKNLAFSSFMPACSCENPKRTGDEYTSSSSQVKFAVLLQQRAAT